MERAGQFVHFVEAKTVNKGSPISMSSIFGGTYQDNSELMQQDGRRKKTSNLV